MTPTSAPGATYHVRHELITEWLKLVGISDRTELREEADHAIVELYGLTPAGTERWEIEKAQTTWQFACDSFKRSESDEDPLAFLNGMQAIDAALCLAFILYIVEPLEDHFENASTTPAQFLFDLLVGITHERSNRGNS